MKILKFNKFSCGYSFKIYLQELWLNNNNVSEIDSKIISTYFDMKRKLRVFSNPWNCQCKTYELIPLVVSDINNKSDIERFTCYKEKFSLINLIIIF